MCNRICGCSVDTCQRACTSCEVFTLNNGRCHTCHRQFNVSCQDKMSTSVTVLCNGTCAAVESHFVPDNNRCTTCDKKSTSHDTTQQIYCIDNTHMKMCSQDVIKHADEETVESSEKMLKQFHHQWSSSYSSVMDCWCDKIVSQSSRVYLKIFKSTDTSINYKVPVILIYLIMSLVVTCASASPSGKLVFVVC